MAENRNIVQEHTVNPNFIRPQDRLVQPGLAHLNDRERPVAGSKGVVELPGRILIGNVDTTRQTLK